jgi:hypothetical protein
MRPFSLFLSNFGPKHKGVHSSLQLHFYFEDAWYLCPTKFCHLVSARTMSIWLDIEHAGWYSAWHIVGTC